MKEQLYLDLSNIEASVKIAHALSSNIRLQIIQLIKNKPLNVSELAKLLNIPISSTALHVNVLEDAQLVITTSRPGLRGSQKVCALKVEHISFHIRDELSGIQGSNRITETIPIGSYFDFQVTAPCGIVSDTAFISPEDNVHGFYLPERSKAQLIWFTAGYLEYRFSSYRSKNLESASSYEFSFEICSEAPGYCNDWKSDVSIWINHRKIGILQTLGDYGGRKGLLNPKWWDENNTQFGLLHHVSVTQDGCYIDDKRVSDETLSSLELSRQPYISFQIGVEEDAIYRGGLNLFGEKFGDYPQNIVMRVAF